MPDTPTPTREEVVAFLACQATHDTPIGDDQLAAVLAWVDVSVAMYKRGIPHPYLACARAALASLTPDHTAPRAVALARAEVLDYHDEGCGVQQSAAPPAAWEDGCRCSLVRKVDALIAAAEARGRHTLTPDPWAEAALRRADFARGCRAVGGWDDGAIESAAKLAYPVTEDGR